MIKDKCKKVISIVMLLVIIATTFSVNVFADGPELSDECEFNEETGELVISRLGGCVRSIIGPELYKYRDRIKSIRIPDGVTSIDEGVFEACKDLTIIIPDSVTSIENRAFCRCENLNIKYLGLTGPSYYSPERNRVSKFEVLLMGPISNYDPSINKGYPFYLASNIKIMVPIHYRGSFFVVNLS